MLHWSGGEQLDKRKATVTEVAEEYRRHSIAKGHSKATMGTYDSCLRALSDTVGTVPVFSIAHEHIDKMFAERNWSAGTRNNRLGQLRAFFAWCRARGYMHRDSDPTFGWRHVKVPNQKRQRIPAQEWEKLFQACKHPHERIVVATGLFLFLRASEQRGIQLKHVHLNTNEIEIYRTKTSDHDVMPISSELHPYIAEHLTYMAQQGWTDPEHYLIGRRINCDRDPETRQFISGTGTLDPTRPLSRPHIVVQRILSRAGYPHFKEGEHTLRRSGARAYFDSLVAHGYDGALRRVQFMLGHSTASMTETYLGLDLDRKQRNEDLKGKPMLPSLQSDNIIQMVKKVQNG